MTFKQGDYIMVLDENLRGIVKKVKGDIISIETQDGFLLDFDRDELVIDNSESMPSSYLFSNSNITHIISEKEEPIRKKTSRSRPKDRYQPKMEVDLHINQLVKSPKGMTNHDILNLQLDTAKHKLEFAIAKRIQKIVFIHGVGEGILKLELAYLFGRYDNIKFYDANYQKYGLGATEVYIYQNTIS